MPRKSGQKKRPTLAGGSWVYFTLRAARINSFFFSPYSALRGWPNRSHVGSSIFKVSRLPSGKSPFNVVTWDAMCAPSAVRISAIMLDMFFTLFPFLLGLSFGFYCSVKTPARLRGLGAMLLGWLTQGRHLSTWRLCGCGRCPWRLCRLRLGSRPLLRSRPFPHRSTRPSALCLQARRNFCSPSRLPR